MTALLAYDGRPSAEKALEYAIRHSVAYDKRLYILLSVTSRETAEKEDGMEKINKCLEKARSAAAANGIAANTMIGIGNPAEEILAAAERINADVIIVGYSNHPAIDRMVHGTVAEHLLRNSKYTVIAVQ
jgi:nucleotide-binding universal stress UspA family protein